MEEMKLSSDDVLIQNTPPDISTESKHTDLKVESQNGQILSNMHLTILNKRVII